MTQVKFLIVFFFLLGCKSNSVFKDYHDFKNALWTIKDEQVFEFEINDSTAFYEIEFLFRNNMEYPYHNLFFNEKLSESEKILSQSMAEVNFFDPVSGKPLGSGLGDLFDSKIQLEKYKKFKFPHNGKFKFTIGHNMRPDPLVGIMSVGISVNKLK